MDINFDMLDPIVTSAAFFILTGAAFVIVLGAIVWTLARRAD